MDKKRGPNKRHRTKPYSSSQSNYQHLDPIGSPTAPEALAEYLLKALGSEANGLTVTCQELEPNHIRVTAACAPDSMGRLIGKGGRTITAIRYLVRGIAETHGKRIDVEVVSSEEEASPTPLDTGAEM